MCFVVKVNEFFLKGNLSIKLNFLLFYILKEFTDTRKKKCRILEKNKRK